MTSDEVIDEQQATFPPFLTRAWLFDLAEAQHSEHIVHQKKWTASSLTEAYLRSQIASQLDSTNKYGSCKAIPSLTSLSIRKIEDILANSENAEEDINAVLRGLPAAVLCRILRDGGMTYTILRELLGQETPASQTGNLVRSLATFQDVDEAVQINERYIRSRSNEDNKDSKYLVTLDDFVKTIGDVTMDCENIISFRRKDPPPGGLELLDRRRLRVLNLLCNSSTFADTFERITNGILKGLDWKNVFVAGGIVLTTCLHTDKSRDGDKLVKDSDIDVYIYDLDAEGANKKIEEIYTVWSSNLPPTNRQKLVIKNARTINFLADYPNRRVQIILKLLQSPTQVLLNFDLDVCAIGFDGKQVLMLPRCARAIETGYSVFTMDLVWGHYLGDRKATRETRVLKYADKGFGLRILPSYANSLEDDTLYDKLANSQGLVVEYGDEPWTTEEVKPLAETFPATIPRKAYDSQDAYRKPEGPEPGLKTLRRVLYLGRDFTIRYCFGRSRLHRILAGEEHSHVSMEAQRQLRQGGLEGNHNEDPRDITVRIGSNPVKGPLINLAKLDTRRRRENVPDGFGGLGQFELFMRHCTAWNLDADDKATLDRDTPSSTLYPEVGAYDNSILYQWDETFDVDVLAARIDIENQTLFDELKRLICSRLSIPYTPIGYRDYLTRRIRRQVHGPDLKTVMDKQITMPLVIPHDLEDLMVNQLPQIYPDLPSHFTSSAFLIAIHRPPSADQAPLFLPSIQDQAIEAGNPRYWVISNLNMWACQHRVVDEVFEILYSFFHLFRYNDKRSIAFDCSTPQALWHLSRDFRRRAILPEVNSNINDQGHLSGLPLREAVLFRAWIFAEPSRYFATTSVTQESRSESSRNAYLDEEDFVYPIPTELFWMDGEEGDWNKDSVPLWRDVEDEETDVLGRKRKRVSSQRT